MIWQKTFSKQLKVCSKDMTHTFSPAIYSSILLGKQIAASSDSPRHLSCLIPRSRARSRLYAALITSCVFYVLTLTDYFHSLFLCLHYDPYYFDLTFIYRCYHLTFFPISSSLFYSALLVRSVCLFGFYWSFCRFCLLRVLAV